MKNKKIFLDTILIQMKNNFYNFNNQILVKFCLPFTRELQ